MQNKPIKLMQIPLELPYRQILFRLGYSSSSQIEVAQQLFLDETIAACFSNIFAKGLYLIVPIASNDGAELVLSDGSRICSSALAKMLSGHQELWLAAATVGPAISELSNNYFATKQAAAATICDAVGSECADAAMDFLQNYASSQLKRSARFLSKRRFSPGYADLSLEVQKDFFRWLELTSFGMELNESFQLIPEKSVTAFAGIMLS